MSSPIFALAPMLIFMFIYLAVIAGIVIFVIVSVNKSLRLKGEQNELLREIIKKMDNK